jgi:hypothetical protein
MAKKGIRKMLIKRGDIIMKKCIFLATAVLIMLLTSCKENSIGPDITLVEKYEMFLTGEYWHLDEDFIDGDLYFGFAEDKTMEIISVSKEYGTVITGRQWYIKMEFSNPTVAYIVVLFEGRITDQMIIVKLTEKKFVFEKNNTMYYWNKQENFH